MTASHALRILDRSNIAEARRATVHLAAEFAFSEAEQSDAAIVCTEIATNLLRHAHDGVLSITARNSRHGRELLLVAVDRGPGIPDLARSLRDGYSTAGSAGTGLGAISRLSSATDIYSTPAGTVLVAAMSRPSSAEAASAVSVGAFTLPKEGQSSNGDAIEWREVDGGLAMLVCDGLGHGEFACQASEAAVTTFRRSPWQGPKEMMDTIDGALRPTRGAAAAVAFIDREAERVRYCGIGNIAALLVSSDGSRHLVSHNGIVGHTSSRTTEFEYALSAESVLIMHSDGVNGRWQPAHLDPLWHRHPGVIAGALFRDFARGNDDVAVVAVRP